MKISIDEITILILSSLILVFIFTAKYSNKKIYLTTNDYLKINLEKTKQYKRITFFIVTKDNIEEGYLIKKKEIELLLKYFEKQEEKKKENFINMKKLQAIEVFEPIRKLNIIIKRLYHYKGE